MTIQERLRADFELLSQDYEVMAVFIQGSQNYKLEYEGSDIDTKAIVLPKFEDLVTAAKPVSYTHVLPSNEHIDIKDIRSMFECWSKQNIQFVEVLFAQEMLINPKYADEMDRLLDVREAIAHANPAVMMNCIVGVAKQKQHAMCHPYPAVQDKIEKYGYDGKQLHHIKRLLDFQQRYAAGEPFSSALIANDPEGLISLKREPYALSLEEALKLADDTVEQIDAFNKQWQKTHSPQPLDLEPLFNQILISSIQKYYESEWAEQREDMLDTDDFEH